MRYGSHSQPKLSTRNSNTLLLNSSKMTNNFACGDHRWMQIHAQTFIIGIIELNLIRGTRSNSCGHLTATPCLQQRRHYAIELITLFDEMPNHNRLNSNRILTKFTMSTEVFCKESQVYSLLARWLLSGKFHFLENNWRQFSLFAFGNWASPFEFDVIWNAISHRCWPELSSWSTGGASSCETIGWML